MEQIASGLTWNQIQALFDADSEFKMTLKQKQRRASLKKRKNGIAEERTVWRLTIQRDHKNFVRTSFKKNLKDASDELLSEAAAEKILAQVNNVIA